MRPIRLEVQGFTAFRDSVVVDFDDADFFALTGPTGSGKSSVIDAICFALYGAVPRLGGKLVAPVISQGLLEARVRLDFSVAGEIYTAVRVVRRSTGKAKTVMGATTKEARLEHGEDVLAGDARSLTDQVEQLLGLTFEHFTKCVVLPQGEFARFLNDEPARRQDLLVNLLGLEVYGRMQQEANRLATEATMRQAMKRQRIEEELSFATPEGLGEARTRRAALDALWVRVEEAGPALAAAESRRAEAHRAMEAASGRVALLVAIATPPDASVLSGEIKKSRGAREKAAAGVAKAEAASEKAIAARGALPERAPLEHAVRAHTDRRAVDAQLATAREALSGLERVEAEAQKALDEAEAAGRAAADAADAARVRNAAAALAAVLSPGDPCPVCGQVVTEVAHSDPPPDLEAAAAEHAKAQQEWKRLNDVHKKAAGTRGIAEQKVRGLEEQIEALVSRLAEHPDPAASERALASVAKAEQGLEAARASEQAARAALAAADRAIEAFQQRERAAWLAFDRARDSVALMEPPAAGRDDLAADWAALAEWAGVRAPVELKGAEQAATVVQAAEEQKASIETALRRAFAEHAIDVEGDRFRDAAVVARERADGTIMRIEAALEEAERVRAEIAAATEEHRVARALGLHLSAKNFEKWILDEALAVLTDGATVILRELSGGAYSLAMDSSGNFSVIDHRNADEPRPAKTLSGGETFLASLSLALALSEHLASMAAEGARLEAIFLDEGFGTLDAETLDIVAAAIENLAAGGRMVGLVTHMPEIAERVPVRFEVTKGPHTSKDEKVLT